MTPLPTPGNIIWVKELNSQYQTLSEGMQVKQQRLRVGERLQANLPKEPLAPIRGQERHKG
jgi:hypothetical protein